MSEDPKEVRFPRRAGESPSYYILTVFSLTSSLCLLCRE
jgi:hypothetical protein